MRAEFIHRLPRYKELSQLQAYVESKQYEGRPDFWSGLGPGHTSPAPLRERKPCIIYPLPKAACSQVVRFCFGEGKFPTLKVEEQVDDTYKVLSLTKDEAVTLTKGLVNVIENGRFRSLIRTLMARGLAERTAVAIMSVKRGRFATDVGHAKDFLPTFKNGDPNDELLAVTWCYQFPKQVETDEGPKTKFFWFRRDITDEAYLDYDPIEVKTGEIKVEWPKPKSTQHGFGFCPVLWIRNLDEGGEKSDIDGCSLIEDLFDEFDALNFALSQRHRGITFFGTPQPYETGVADDDGPEADGRRANTPRYAPAMTRDGLTTAEVTRGKQSQGASAERARRLAPDRIWSYEGDNVSVGLIETTGKAFEVATLHVEDVRGRLLESMSVVLANVDQFAKGGGDMNAKFLILCFAPLLNLVGELRDATWWPQGLLALISMALRILAKTQGDGIVMPEAKTLATLVARFEVTTTEPGAPSAAPGGAATAPTSIKVWMLPKVTPIWGDAFEPSNGEIAEATTAASTAREKKIIPLKSAVQFVASYYGIDDVDAAVAGLESEAEEQAVTDQENALSLTEAKKPAPGEAPAEGEPAPAKKPAKPTNGPKPPKG